MKPTGNYRNRTHNRIFRTPLLVLQIEETGTVFSSQGGQIEADQYTRWRDARVEDLPFKWFKASEQ